MPSLLAETLNKLKGVRDSGAGQYTALCPAHDDTNPSLSVTWKDGKALLHCHAGCAQDDVRRAAKLQKWGHTSPREVEKVYEYRDEDDELSYEVVRYRPKTFRPRRPDPNDPLKRIWNLNGVEPLPYRLPELAEALVSNEPVWIVEGEKDVDTLASRGVVATCNHGGAGKSWSTEHSRYFIGSESTVTIVADRDVPGYKHALKVHASLLKVAGITATVVMPANGKDATDHLAEKGTIDSFTVTTVDELTVLSATEDKEAVAERESKVAERVESLRIDREARRSLATEEATGLFAGFLGISLREALALPREPTSMIIEGLQGAGHKAVLVAQYKTGKTTLSANVVRALVDERPLFGRFPVHPLDGNVGVLDYELTDEDALDLYESMQVENIDRIFMQSLRGTGFTLANDTHAELVVKWLVQHDIRYLSLDPFGRAMRGFGEENSNDDVRGFFMRVDTIAREARLLGVLMTVHTGRVVTEVGSERARGATVLDDDPDARWILTKDNQQRRFFRAEGRRGVGVEEISLEFDPARRLLTASGTTRAESAGERFMGPVLAFVEGNPGATLNEIKQGVEGTDKNVAAAVKLCIKDSLLLVQMDGQRHRHFPGPGTPVIRLSKTGTPQ